MTPAHLLHPTKTHLLPHLRALRPEQWTKNALVGAAWVFAFGDRTTEMPPHAAPRALAATLLFCLVSSGVYLVNDVRDRELDRKHPKKQNRPIAAGLVEPSTALGMAALLAAGSLGVALLFSVPLSAVLAGYLMLQVGYTFAFKHIPYLDVLILSLGFVLRAYAGAVALPVPASPWLLGCTFLLALFLALCKRRHEKSVLRLEGDGARPSLRGVTGVALDRIIDSVAVLTVLVYALYTLSSDSMEKFGDRRLLTTLPFVLYGILRYRKLVLIDEQGGRPEKQLFSDPRLLATYFLYMVTLLLVLQGLA